MSVLVRSPSKTRGYFSEASLHTIGSSLDSPYITPSFSQAVFPILPTSCNNELFQSFACFTYFVTPSYTSTAAQEYLTCFPSPTLLTPRLRVRLTQVRRTLSWNPWVFGEGDFHPLYRLLMPCIITSMRSSTPRGIPSPHILRSSTASTLRLMPAISALCFSPAYYRRKVSRLVSCYALFK